MLLKLNLIIFLCSWLVSNCNFGLCRVSRRRSTVWKQNVAAALNAPLDMKQFLIDSYRKMGDIDCTTVIWESATSSTLGSITFCESFNKKCAYKYIINYNGGNITEKLARAFKAGYREQCAGYIFLLKNTKTVTNLLHLGDDSRMINTRGRFLIWYQKKDESFERDEIWKKISNVILFNMTTNTRTGRLSFTISEIKWPVVSVNLKESAIRALDFWRYGKGFKKETKWYWDKTVDLKNMTLNILVVEHPPGVIKYKSVDGKVNYAGIEIEIVKTLKTKMNFNIELVDGDTSSDTNGQEEEQGVEGEEPGEEEEMMVNAANATENFYGAVSSLIYGETDMAIGSFFILKHYLEFIDMSIPLDVVCTSFLTPTPLPRPRYLALILPFSWNLWILVLSTCLVLTPLILYGLTRPKFHQSEYSEFSERIQVILTSTSMMCQVSLALWPKFWSVRTFIGGFWLFTLFITLAYRGAMVSFLSIPFFEDPIDNLNDLAASGLRIGGWGVELQRLFTQQQVGGTPDGESESDKVKALLVSKYEVIGDLNVGISMVSEGKFALYENRRFLRFTRLTRNLSKSGRPTMRLMKQCIVPVHIGIAYQKNSAITETINRHLRRFGESGLTKKWGSRLVELTKAVNKAQSTYNNNNDQHKDGDKDDGGDEDSEVTSEQKQRVLTMADLQGSVYLILFGVLVSILTFIVELTIAHTRIARTTNDNVNRLKKLVETTVLKTKSVIDDRRFLLDYETNFQPRIRQRNQQMKKKKFGLCKQKQPPFPYID